MFLSIMHSRLISSPLLLACSLVAVIFYLLCPWKINKFKLNRMRERERVKTKCMHANEGRKKNMKLYYSSVSSNSYFFSHAIFIIFICWLCLCFSYSSIYFYLPLTLCYAVYCCLCVFLLPQKKNIYFRLHIIIISIMLLYLGLRHWSEHQFVKIILSAYFLHF